MSGVSSHRGANKRPGEYKIDQNFIGGKIIHNARFIPVPPGLTVEAMDHLEAYINEDEQNGIPPLINAALIHYQFETIHPFADGNGRVGRILVPVYLLQKGVLQSPILYISPSIEEDKDMYIDLMYKVSSSSQWLEWIIYFLNVVKSACEESIETINAMVALQERYRKKSHEISRSPTTFKIVEYLFERPIVTIPMAASVAGVTYPSAANAINMLEENGILRHLRNTNNPKMFIAPEIIKLSAGISEN
jgi:Fic family protein